MRYLRSLALWIALCLLAALMPMSAQGIDRLQELGAWEAFDWDDSYKQMSYDSLFHDEQRGIILVILYSHKDQAQLLFRLDKVGDRWKHRENWGFYSPSYELGTLQFMNSEEPGMPELVHSHFDQNGKGYWERFWFEYDQGNYWFKEADLSMPLDIRPLAEQGLILRQTPEGITGQRYHYVRDSVQGKQMQGEPQLLSAQKRLPFSTQISTYPRGEFLSMLATQGLIFAAPKHMPQSAKDWLGASPYAAWRLTGWAQPAGGDTAFLTMKSKAKNTLLALQQAGEGWTLLFDNPAALPQGEHITMGLNDASGGQLLESYEDMQGNTHEFYGTALHIYGDDGNGEYFVRSSIWEKDAQGRWMLSFYGHEGQSGMMQFDQGRRRYLDHPYQDWVRDDSKRDLSSFSFDQLPDPYWMPTGKPHGQADALISNPNPADRLNLRKEPRKNADMIGRYYSGVPVTVLEDKGGDWVKVWIGWDRQGYMMRKFLAFGDAMMTVRSAMPVYHMTKLWQLYYEPYASSNIKTSYQGGQTIEVMGLMDGWWHVRLQDEPEEIGFIPQIEPL